MAWYGGLTKEINAFQILQYWVMLLFGFGDHEMKHYTIYFSCPHSCSTFHSVQANTQQLKTLDNWTDFWIANWNLCNLSGISFFILAHPGVLEVIFGIMTNYWSPQRISNHVLLSLCWLLTDPNIFSQQSKQLKGIILKYGW